MSEIDLQDAILRHSLQILRLSAGEQAAVDEIMRNLEADLRAMLGSVDLTAAKKAQIQELINAADKAIAGRYDEASTATDTYGLAVVVAEQTRDIIGGGLPDGVTVNTPSAARLASLTRMVMIDGAPSRDWWARQSDDTAFKFASQVRQGIVNGESQARIVQRIVGKGAEPGIMTVSRRNARALVHSSVMTAANQARLATYRKNARLIAGVRWLATLDGHTCPRCAALDHQAWDLDGKPMKGTKVEFMAPPIHWNDRCILSVIPKTFTDIGLDIPEPTDAGTRASSMGQIDAKTTFGDFLKRQSPEFIDRTLGKKRAELFRAGKITVRDLISGTGRELTLDELKTH